MGGGGNSKSISLTQLQQQQGSSSSDGVVAGVFRINTGVSSFKRLVNMLGTSEDTPPICHPRVAVRSLRMRSLLRTSKLCWLRFKVHRSLLSLERNRSLPAWCSHFHYLHLLLQTGKQGRGSGIAAANTPGNYYRSRMKRSIMKLRQRSDREQGIQEIQNQIGEVSEIFKDLAQIVANFDLPKLKHLSGLPPP